MTVSNVFSLPAIAAATGLALVERKRSKDAMRRAIALRTSKRCRDEEARQRAEAQAEAVGLSVPKPSRRNAAEEARKAQAYLLAQIAAQQAAQQQTTAHRGEEAKIERMEEAEGAALAAAKAAKPQRDERAYQDYRAGERNAEAIAADYQARKAVQEYRQGEREEFVTLPPACTVENVEKPKAQTFIGPAPTPTATPAPTATPPAISGEDVANGICEAADAVDPVMPNPETVGGPDVGDIIDQAYVAQQSTPYASAGPLFEALVRVPIVIAKVFKDGPSTVVNFICQQRDRTGPYYELFPIDQKIQSVKD